VLGVKFDFFTFIDERVCERWAEYNILILEEGNKRRLKKSAKMKSFLAYIIRTTQSGR
jgi:hypothetical protein